MPLTLYRRKNRPNWYMRGTVREYFIDESTRVRKKRDAEEIKTKREAELLERSIHGAKATASFGEAADLYQVAGGESRFMTPLLQYFKTTPLSKIDQAAIDRCAHALYPHAKPSTRKRQVYVPMAAVLNFAAERGLTDYRRLRHPKVKKAEFKWATPEQLEALLDECKPKLRSLVIFLAYSGCRIGEALSITWDMVDLPNRTIRLPRTKNDEPRAVHLPDIIFLDLANRQARTDPVFYYHHRWSVYKPLKAACERAGVPYFNPHAFRHTFATWLRIYGGLDRRGIQAAVGWKDGKSADRYTHVLPDEAAKAADLLPMNISRTQGKKG